MPNNTLRGAFVDYKRKQLESCLKANLIINRLFSSWRTRRRELRRQLSNSFSVNNRLLWTWLPLLRYRGQVLLRRQYRFRSPPALPRIIILNPLGATTRLMRVALRDQAGDWEDRNPYLFR